MFQSWRNKHVLLLIVNKDERARRGSMGFHAVSDVRDGWRVMINKAYQFYTVINNPSLNSFHLGNIFDSMVWYEFTFGN